MMCTQLPLGHFEPAVIRGRLGGVSSLVSNLFWRCLGLLVFFCLVLSCLLRRLGGKLGRSGAAWDPLGHSWEPRGASLGPLGGSWGGLGGGRRTENKKRQKRMQHNDAKTVLLASRWGSVVGRKREEA